ncbi:peptide antibiotic transporter SbmA [Alphaproteobacteria bacterium]|nr:peptide antibiotic transporter SbmA [Alphaproteobacteria bacterium]
MFESFFPRPKLFFNSLIVYIVITAAIWFGFGAEIGSFLGFELRPSDAEPIVGIGFFFTPNFFWLYLYFASCTLVFWAIWQKIAPHKWHLWSILGSAFILFTTYFGVQVSVAINHWRRPFGDLLQNALQGEEGIVALNFYDLFIIFAQIAFMAVILFTVTRFFVSHYVFRWRTAMNDYYLAQWPRVRHVEGASQRIQEDTMRFASIVEGLGVSIVDSIMTLFAFLPILWGLSQYVTVFPLVGEIPAPLMSAVIFWSLLGTFLMVVVGIKLPGLYFRNQRVEAAFRKELVLGEDNEKRGQPITFTELFTNVRRNYFRLYFHYFYFNVARSFYLQADNIFVYVILVPTIVAAKITYGILQQILTAFGQVSNSFQFLVNSWPTIVELLSIHKRLQSFEAAIADRPLPKIDQDYLAGRED